MISVIVFIVIAYLFGSLSSATIVCKLMKSPDPRKEGSGNPGTINVLRIAGKKASLFTLIGDVLKGAIPILLARFFFHIDGFSLGLVAIGAILGHLYPVFFKFKGGKGVATFFGTILALSIPIFIVVIITWLIIAILFRYSSLASLIASMLAPLYAFIFEQYGYMIAMIIIALIIVWRHKENIKRLRFGTENRIKLGR